MDSVTTLVTLGIGFVLVLILVGGSFFLVEQAQVAMVERFGRFDRLAPPECPELAPLWQK